MSNVDYKPLPTSKPVPHVEVPLDVRPAPRVEVARRPPCLLKTCCCLRLSTGVWIMGVMDIVCSVLLFICCVFFVVMKEEERPLDHVLQHGLEDKLGNSTNATATIADTVDHFNHSIEAGFRSTPVFAIAAFLALYFGLAGLRASRGSIRDALVYCTWKAVKVICALFFQGVLAAVVAFYFALVARAHWLDLTMKVLPVTTPVLVQTVTPSTPPTAAVAA